MARRFEIVIDSSVAVKWFSEEEATSDALKLGDSHVEGRTTLITTPLLACELANALRYKPDRPAVQERIILLFWKGWIS